MDTVPAHDSCVIVGRTRDATGTRKSFPIAHDRTANDRSPPDAKVLEYVARLREELESDDGYCPDEGVPGKNADLNGCRETKQVGVGYVERDLCNGQSLASPYRIYPTSERWKSISDVFRRFADHYDRSHQEKWTSALFPRRRWLDQKTSSSVLLLRMIFYWKGETVIGRTFQSTTRFSRFCSDPQAIRRLDLGIILRVSVSVWGQGCQGCPRSSARKESGACRPNVL